MQYDHGVNMFWDPQQLVSYWLRERRGMNGTVARLRKWISPGRSRIA